MQVLDKSYTCYVLILGKEVDGTDKNFLSAWYKRAAEAGRLPSCW